MGQKRFVVMGAGEVGFHLARTLSSAHAVTLIDASESVRQSVEEQLDVRFVPGNGSRLATLEAAGVGDCELFVAVSSSDEANLTASRLAKQLGASRTVVRMAASEDVTRHGRAYERAFDADLLLSTQLLATTRILNQVLGYNTLEIEYLAGGALQIRKSHVEPGSVLHERPLAQVDLPDDCLVLAFVSEEGITVPTGADRAQPGDDALIFGKTEVLDEVEKRISGRATRLGTIAIAGGGSTARAVAARLSGLAARLKIIERQRGRAEGLAAEFPNYEIVHGDATDMSLLAAEAIGRAEAFIALTGNDESNLMACLLAQELGARQITALVNRSETSSLWRKVGLLDVVSPRAIAAEYITEYIASDYQRSIFSLRDGSARFVQRRIERESPAAGGQLAEIVIPRGLLVAAVLRRGEAVIPRGDMQLEVGDEVILFVHRNELDTLRLIFPGPEGR